MIFNVMEIGDKSGVTYKTSGFMDRLGGRYVKVVDTKTGHTRLVHIDKVAIKLNGKYKPLVDCINGKHIIFDYAFSRFDFPNSDVERAQGYNWV